MTGCHRSVEGQAASVAAAAPTPTTAAALGSLVVTDVPSGLPRLPDDELDPPAGEKTVDQQARYAEDPEHERQVLEGYGYRFGWERFWGSGTGSGPMTGVFLDQFEDRAGAVAYAKDLAGNEAEYLSGMLESHPADLPGGCWLLTVAEPDAGDELSGPTALAWCAHGVFSVSVTAVADSLPEAEKEVRAVLAEQFGRLPAA